jgi:hypothetical protein
MTDPTAFLVQIVHPITSYEEYILAKLLFSYNSVSQKKSLDGKIMKLFHSSLTKGTRNLAFLFSPSLVIK